MAQIAAAPRGLGAAGSDSSLANLRVGRRLIVALAGLACAAATWSILPFLSTAPSPAETPSTAAHRSLGIAIRDVLDATKAKAAPTGDEAATANLEDAWEGLTNAHGYIRSQLDYPGNRRVPHTGAPPPSPAQIERDDALLRSALTYVHGALDTRDTTPLHRALELLDLGTSAPRR